MGCLFPRPATRTEYGDKPIRMWSDFEQAYWESEDGSVLPLACGRCGPCRARKRRDMAIRATHTLPYRKRLHSGVWIPEASFVTLTYDDQHMPDGEQLEKKALQLFIQRLRNYKPGLRYLCCGEYGDTTARPHYHLLLIGADFHHDRVPLRTDAEGYKHYTSESLTRLWPFGFHDIATASYASASYVAGYITKKMIGFEREPVWGSDYEEATVRYGAKELRVRKSGGPIPGIYSGPDGKEPEFKLQSKSLGEDWFNEHWHNTYTHDRVIIEGKDYPPPRYYDYLLAKRDPATYHDVVRQRISRMEKRETSSFSLEVARKNDAARQRLFGVKERAAV